MDDRHILLLRQIVSPVRWSPEVMETDKRECDRTDIEVAIDPGGDTDACANGALRRKGRPAAIIAIIALTPGDPRRRPFVARNPDPASSGNTHPSAIVIRRPSEIFVRNPAPTAIGPYPMSI